MNCLIAFRGPLASFPIPLWTEEFKMSATPFTKERFWLPGSIALIVAFVAAGCGGGTPAPTPTGDDSNTTDTTAASNPGAGGGANAGGGGNTDEDMMNPDMSTMMTAADENGSGDPTNELGDPAAGGIPGDPIAGAIPGGTGAISGDPTAGAIPGGTGAIPGDPAAGGIPGDPAAGGIPGDPAAGGIPGDPAAGGIPGDPAAGGDIRAGGGGNAQPQAPPEDSPAFPAFHLVMGLMNGKPADIGKYVGKRATGDLATIRTGKLSAKRVAELKATFARPTLISQKRISGGTQINLRSGEQVINITVKKEGGAFKVSDMKIRKSSSRR
jgi:hypothetical protein